MTAQFIKIERFDLLAVSPYGNLHFVNVNANANANVNVNVNVNVLQQNYILDLWNNRRRRMERCLFACIASSIEL